ncbi:MAG: thioredoxin domain-containing protein [Candidatus Roseilinea sp.]|nr:MAG: thioredoxin domain-containing protein [Candidatus Roseilinea sp.]
MGRICSEGILPPSVDNLPMANESKVIWREWSDEAFAEAKAQDKPVLLGISAVWCHWCHVMDRGVPGDPVHTGVYNDSQIADYINANFIPIRVDNDQRPDINARYNMGGWPTTCFLTPDGDVIYGATYLAPAQMRQLLPRVVEVWRNDREEILKQLKSRTEDTKRKTQAAPPTLAELQSSVIHHPSSIIEDVSGAIIRNFDPRHGGLGNGQKFPMSDAWELLLAIYAQTRERRLLDMVVKTLIAMGTRGMYDLVAGGWFRYSTTPDWSVPHFEKMLEDHGRLVPVYLHAVQLCRETGREDDAVTLTKVVRASLDYLTATLLHDAPGLTYFAGSQDADEVYYLLSREERAKLPAPFIDWRLYADWNALMVSALLQAGVVLDQPAYADLAARVWHTLVDRCVNDDGSVTHSLVSKDGAMVHASLRGQLGDQAALAKAGLDLAQFRPELAADALAVVRRIVDFAMRELRAPEGNFYDSPANPNAQGMLRIRIQPIFDNCTLAEALLMMSYLADEADWRQVAQVALAAFGDEYKRYREHAAPYALAVMRATQLPDEVMIVGRGDEVLPFIRTAHATYSPWRIVRALDPDRDAAFIAQRGYPMTRLPVAFVCRGTACSAPIYAPEDLRAAST